MHANLALFSANLLAVALTLQCYACLSSSLSPYRRHICYVMIVYLWLWLNGASSVSEQKLLTAYIAYEKSIGTRINDLDLSLEVVLRLI